MADVFHIPDGSGFASLSSEFAQFTSTFFSPQPTSETDAPLESATDPNSLLTTSSSTSSDPLTTSSSSSTTSVPSTSSTPITTTQVSTPSVVATSSMTSSSTSAAATSTESLIAANSDTDTKSGASPAAIGVTVTLLILGICAAAVFLFRRHQRNKRLARRLTWQMPVGSPKPQPMMFDDVEKASSDGHATAALMENFETIDINEKRGPTPLHDVNMYNVPVKLPTPPGALHPSGYAPPRMPSPPPMEMMGAGSSPVHIGVEAPSFGPGGQAPLITATPFSATMSVPRSSVTPSLNSAMGAQISHGTLVVVARTFVPSLPDELSIQTGEQVRIISKYDDGWAHVERLRSGAGENGVVPMECLEVVSGAPAAAPVVPQVFSGPGLSQEAVESWRLSKRKSSLHPVGPAMY